MPPPFHGRYAAWSLTEKAATHPEKAPLSWEWATSRSLVARDGQKTKNTTITNKTYINSVEIQGFVGADAEPTDLEGGKTVLNFSVATNRFCGEGENREQFTEWHKVTGALRENLMKCPIGELARVPGFRFSDRGRRGLATSGLSPTSGPVELRDGRLTGLCPQDGWRLGAPEVFHSKKVEKDFEARGTLLEEPNFRPSWRFRGDGAQRRLEPEPRNSTDLAARSLPRNSGLQRFNGLRTYDVPSALAPELFSRLQGPGCPDRRATKGNGQTVKYFI